MEAHEEGRCQLRCFPRWLPLTCYSSPCCGCWGRTSWAPTCLLQLLEASEKGGFPPPAKPQIPPVWLSLVYRHLAMAETFCESPQSSKTLCTPFPSSSLFCFLFLFFLPLSVPISNTAAVLLPSSQEGSWKQKLTLGC